MDELKVPYLAQMVFVEGLPPFPIRWYFASDTATEFVGDTVFTSSVYMTDKDNHGYLGEVIPDKYVKSTFTPSPLPAGSTVIGRPEWWRTGIPLQVYLDAAAKFRFLDSDLSTITTLQCSLVVVKELSSTISAITTVLGTMLVDMAASSTSSAITTVLGTMLVDMAVSSTSSAITTVTCMMLLDLSISCTASSVSTVTCSMVVTRFLTSAITAITTTTSALTDLVPLGVTTCSSCPGGAFGVYYFNPGTATNGTCSTCSTFNQVFTLEYRGSCTWTTDNFTVCSANTFWAFFKGSGNEWGLACITGAINYSSSFGSSTWDCESDMVLTRTAQFACNMPLTIIVSIHSNPPLPPSTVANKAELPARFPIQVGR